MISPASLKRCNACGRLQPLGDFYVSRTGRSKDGRQAECKECTRVRLATYRAENLEAVRARERERAAARRAARTPEEQDAARAAARQRIAEESVEQREHRLAYFREYRRRQKALRAATT
jgi:hypothetical protein